MKCENCNKEHDGKYGSGRFCCKHCAKSYSSKQIDHTKIKILQCKQCNKNIFVNIHVSHDTALCKECLTKNRLKKCKICGSLYNKHDGCLNSFCRSHNIQQFKTFIKYFNFDETKLGTQEVENEFNRVRNELYDLYWNKKMSGADIAKLYNYPSGANIVGKILKYLNIPKRTPKEYAINTYLTGNVIPNRLNNQYKCCWHTTWNNKEVYLRSSYELDYANELDEQHINYDCECLRIKYLNTQDNEYHCAIPDFYLIDTNTIVEIKSNWTFDIQNMKDKFKAYKELGYNCKLILDHKEVNLYELKFE